MKGLCPECGKIHPATAVCSTVIEHFKADACRDENDRLAEERRRWDEWYAGLPTRLKARLSVQDFKLLGDLFQQVFSVR